MFPKEEDLGTTATQEFYPYGQKTSDLLSELGSIGEDADREIMDIFLSYGWEILDKLRPYMDTIRNGQATSADLEACVN